jgi:ABC-type nitrate/sulfonate/bicarbonate transport system substrate-binding protein
LKQLAGKRIGYQSHEFYVPATMMSCVGVPQTGWRPVQVGFDIVQLTAHHVDAYLTFITNEPIALAMNGVKTTTFHASQYCFHFYDDVMFTTDKLIKSNPKLVSTVTSIVARGFKWAHQHPQSAALYTVHNTFPASVAGSDIFGKATTANENQVQQIRELKAFDQFSRDPRGQFSGLMTASYWQDGINILAKYNQIKSKPAVGSLFTNQFNPNK